jgi:hypothetical protein
MKHALTSIAEPIGGARGSMARPGTKNTGNHLMSQAAPGAIIAHIASDAWSHATVLTIISKANKMQHPPNCDGNVMFSFWNNLRKKISAAKKKAIPWHSLDVGTGTAAPPLTDATAT